MLLRLTNAIVGIVWVVYTYSAWASALLVLIRWAMREPQSMGRVTDTDSHAFFVLIRFAESGVSIGNVILYYPI